MFCHTESTTGTITLTHKSITHTSEVYTATALTLTQQQCVTGNRRGKAKKWRKKTNMATAYELMYDTSNHPFRQYWKRTLAIHTKEIKGNFLFFIIVDVSVKLNAIQLFSCATEMCEKRNWRRFSVNTIEFPNLVRHFFEKFCSKYRFIWKILVCVTVREVNWLAKRYRPLFEYPQCTHAYVRKFFCSPIPVANWIEIFQKVSIGSNLNWNWSVPWISLRVYERLFLLTFYNLYPFAKFRIQFINPFKFISKFWNVFLFYCSVINANQK